MYSIICILNFKYPQFQIFNKSRKTNQINITSYHIPILQPKKIQMSNNQNGW